MMFVTPDKNDDNNQCVDDSADDEDYDPAPVANPPPPKSRPKMVVRNKNSKPKLVLDCNFMRFLRLHTFDHEPSRRGKQNMYPIAEMKRFNADFCIQLHFNFLATRTTQK